MWDRAVADDVGSVVEKASINPPVNRQLNSTGNEWARGGRGSDIFGKHMGFIASVAGRLVFCGRSWSSVDFSRRIVRHVLNWKFRLVLVLLAFLGHCLFLHGHDQVFHDIIFALRGVLAHIKAEDTRDFLLGSILD